MPGGIDRAEVGRDGDRSHDSARVGGWERCPPIQHRVRTQTSGSDRSRYDELLARDKASLDIFWLRDESLEDTDNLPAPEVIAAEIVEDLQAALDEFSAIASTLSATEVAP